MINEQGEVIGSVTTFEDISALKAIDRMKSDFVAMVAHELKSPLASVEQMIYALQVGCKYEAASSCNALHQRMTARTKDLLRLIENLLNLSKLESGTVVFNLEPVRRRDHPRRPSTLPDHRRRARTSLWAIPPSARSGCSRMITTTCARRL